MKMNKFPIHLPPAPMRGNKELVLALPPDDWALELKINGDRALIFHHPNGQWDIYSRHGRPLPVVRNSHNLMKLVKNLPVGWAVEGEWLSCSDIFFVFDVIWAPVNSQQEMDVIPGRQTSHTYDFRREVVRIAVDLMDNPSVFIMPRVNSNFVRAYEHWRKWPFAEGVVAKRRNSSYVASFGNTQQTSDWIKFRYNYEITNSLSE